MRLSTYTDFGLRTLMYLATLPEGQLSSAAEVSSVYNISLNHLVKVAGQLKKLGYLEATRGKNGGICLALSAQDINVGLVIRQLENHLDGVDCSSTNCKLVPVCRLRKALALAMEDFLKVMDGYSLADLIANKEQLVPLFSDVNQSDLGN